MDAEARRARKEEQRAAREAARHRADGAQAARDHGRHRTGAQDGGPPVTPTPSSGDAEPPTRELSLTDELFGITGEDDDQTVQLPRVNNRGDDR